MTAQDEKPGGAHTGAHIAGAKMPRSKAQREADLLALSSLYLQGYTQAEMGERFGVSQSQISLDLMASFLVFLLSLRLSRHACQ